MATWHRSCMNKNLPRQRKKVSGKVLPYHHWLEQDLQERFRHRILPVDLKVALKWGAIQAKAEQAGASIPTIDGLIAATGLVYGCTVVTRNVDDMRQSQAELLNPWDEPCC